MEISIKKISNGYTVRISTELFKEDFNHPADFAKEAEIYLKKDYVRERLPYQPFPTNNPIIEMDRISVENEFFAKTPSDIILEISNLFPFNDNKQFNENKQSKEEVAIIKHLIVPASRSNATHFHTVWQIKLFLEGKTGEKLSEKRVGEALSKLGYERFNKHYKHFSAFVYSIIFNN